MSLIEHDLEKRRLEKEAIELFISCLKVACDKEYRLIQQQERPDAIIEDEKGNRLGLEVTYLFYDEQEAKILLGRSEQETHRLEYLGNHIKVLNLLLEKKAKTGRGYSIDYPCSLLIKNASPIWTVEDFDRFSSRIIIPTNTYQDIWLLSRGNFSSWSLIRLG